MTLGDKIRKYRLLHDMTQRQLGEEVGFKKSTADVRINQYETDKMAPKANIREEIANVLDIDLEAISDVSVTSYLDLIYLFFELEENLGMTIEKKEGKTALVFDDSNKELTTLISYLNLWKNQKDAMLPDAATATEEQKKNYMLWKSRFHKNVTDYYMAKEKAINDYYAPVIETVRKSVPYAVKTSEITILLRKIIEAGFTLSTRIEQLGVGSSSQGFCFTVNELLDPPSEKARDLFAQFLSEIQHFIELGAACYTDLQMPGKSLTITYFIPVSTFAVITEQIKEFLEFWNNKEMQNDFTIDHFERTFTADLERYWNDIKTEIESISK